jgi:hypothetical protein
MASCYDQGDCILTSSNWIRVDFYNSQKRAEPKAILFDSALAFPPGLIVKDTFPPSRATIYLPVDPTQNQTTFLIYYDKKVETLVFSYTTQSKVLSPDCGTYSYQNDLTIVSSTLPADSAVVVNQQLRINFTPAKDLITNVKIYH